jgi:hypothetical protein
MSEGEKSEEPWVCSGSTEEHEDELIGNREGFRLLKQRIDDVLETGRVQVKEGGIEWIGLKLVADDPRKKKSVSQARDLVAVLFFGATVALVLFIFIVGVGTLYKWWK